jgi:hypothetical protein
MTWEQYASVVHVLCKVFGDFKSKLEVQMHVSYADFYVCLRTVVVLCTKLPDVPFLLVPGSSSTTSTSFYKYY